MIVIISSAKEVLFPSALVSRFVC